MKLGLLGDVHGNALALEAVLLAAANAGVKRLLVAGDIVGYYFEPRKTIALLAPWPKDIVLGNHESMLQAARMTPDILPALTTRYGTGLAVALEELNENQLDELCSLPPNRELIVDGRRIMLCHGTPWDTDQYVYPDAPDELLERCALKDFDLVVMGHTHYPMIHQVGHTLVINPGSVGQPRNRQPGAHWALYDTANNSVELRREMYDITSIQDECLRRHPELPYIADFLSRT